MQSFKLGAVAVTAVAGILACAGDVPTSTTSHTELASVAASPTGRYVLLSTGQTLPSGLAGRISAAGGTLSESHDAIGVAVVESDDPGFRAKAARIPGVASVTPDLLVQWTPEDLRVVDVPEGAVGAVEPAVASIADNEGFYFLQWAPATVQAPEAWNAGYTGQGVRVAILDGGVHAAHVDLAPNLDVAASRSFVPGFAFNQDVGTFWHGTHVAGIVGAADNSIGTIGIAPHATLIGVKVLHNGSGAFSWVIDGILYAATSTAAGGGGAQIINMSLGLTTGGVKDPADKADLRELMKAIDRATQYAHQQGVVVIAAAGNDATDHDDNDVLSTPAQNLSVISVAATGPLGWAFGATDYTRSASYTNYGKKVVTLAAPGGDFAYPGNQVCNIGIGLIPCWALYMYISTSRGGAASTSSYTWAAGTSMAAPVAAGVAALILEAAGGQASPAYVEGRLKQGAADLGKAGFDVWYGHGYVNAYRSVMQ